MPGSRRPLSIAVDNVHLEMVGLLLRHGADRDNSDCHFRKTAATEYDRKPGIK
jgi:hypothetical protein